MRTPDLTCIAAAKLLGVKGSSCIFLNRFLYINKRFMKIGRDFIRGLRSSRMCMCVSKALSLLQCAADKNQADAQYLLACQLQSGDFEQSIELLKRASTHVRIHIFNL